MKIIVSPQRGDYKLFFYDKHHVEGEGAVELVKTSKGFRPKNYRLKISGIRQFSNTPTKELISQLRYADIFFTVFYRIFTLQGCYPVFKNTGPACTDIAKIYLKII